MKTTYKAQRRYGKTNKTMFKSENKQEVLDFINEVAQVAEPSIGLDGFDLDEED